MRRNPSTALAGSSLPRTNTALPAPPERDVAGEIVGSPEREGGKLVDEQGNRVDAMPTSAAPVTTEFKKQLTAYFQACIKALGWPPHSATTAFSNLWRALGIKGRPPKLEAKTSTERSQDLRKQKKIAEILAKGDTPPRERTGVDIEGMQTMRTGNNAILHNPDPEDSLIPGPNTLSDTGDVRRGRIGGGIGHESLGHGADADGDIDFSQNAESKRETDSTFIKRRRFPLNDRQGLTRKQESATQDFVEEQFTIVRDDRLEKVGDEWKLKEDADVELKRAELHCELCRADGQSYVITADEWDVYSHDWEMARVHIMDEHREKLREYLKVYAPGPVKFPEECPAADHERMRKIIPPSETNEVHCEVCRRVIYWPPITMTAPDDPAFVKRSKKLKKDPPKSTDMS
jgi:hypothetical protein